MNWKTVGCICCFTALLAGCPTTKNPYGNGGSGNSDAYTDDELNNPNSPLARRNIYFDFDSSAIRSQDRSTIENHSNYLKAKPNRNIQVQGNTDARGSREYNIGLGQRRAESVRQAFLLLGVPGTQLEAVSFGKERPRALGNTDSDHQENRRADIVYDGESGRDIR